jgi:beta-lactam-binding protein with PASTA domain
MTGFIVLFRIFIVIGVIGFILFMVSKNHAKKSKPVGSLDDIEKESIEIINKKNEIRGVTEQTQEQINNINKNLNS